MPKQMLPLLPPTRYEDEINRRTVAENEFVTLKKVRANYRAASNGSLQSSKHPLVPKSSHSPKAFVTGSSRDCIVEIRVICKQEFKTLDLNLLSSRMLILPT